MMSDIEAARHATERGDILRTLKEDYVAEMTSVASLERALDALGLPISQESLGLHLVYLADQGYLRIWRGKDMPRSRRDRRSPVSPGVIRFAKLLPKGLQLLDGDIPEDPKVAF